MSLPYISRRSAVYSRHGMVATSQPLASEIGLRILKAGGNAVDAAIAIAAALNVTEPCSTGIGGDCFLLYYDNTSKTVQALNGSGRSAAAATPQAIKQHLVSSGGEASPPEYIPSNSVHAITVPGTAAGWVDAIDKWGSMPVAQVLEPAAKLAEEGFPVGPVTAHFWGRGEAQLRQGPHAEEMMVMDPDTNVKRPPRAGEIFTNPGLARVLRSVAEHGKDGFYKGWVAEQVVRVVSDLGGSLTMEDLAHHETTFPEPIKVGFRGHDLYEVPPNGQGITALLALNMLDKLPAEELRGDGPASAKNLHYLVESLRLAFADTRHYVTDMDQYPVPVEELLSEAYANDRRAKIDPTKAQANVKRGTPLASCDTVSFQVVDGNGNAVSMVNSNYEGFGSGIVPLGCGFTLQNRGANFNLRDESHPNVVAPRKRPYHTIIPAMVLKEDELYASFTVMGGFMQPQGHVQMMYNMIDCSMDPQEALDAPRFCIADGTGNGKVYLEEGIPQTTIDELINMGHTVEKEPVTGHARALFGRGQIIKRNPKNGVLCGGSDGRADGQVMGW